MFIHENTLRIIPTPMFKRKFYLILRFTTNKQTRVIINDVVSVSSICSTGRDVQTGLQKGSFNGNNYLCVANGGDNHSAPFDVSLATPFYLLFVFLKPTVSRTDAAVLGFKSLISWKTWVSFWGTKVFWSTASKYGMDDVGLNERLDRFYKWLWDNVDFVI